MSATFRLLSKIPGWGHMTCDAIWRQLGSMAEQKTDKPARVSVSTEMPKWCAAVGCKELQTKTLAYCFHSFPTNAERRQWVVQNESFRSAKKLWEPKTHDRLCSKHFDTHCFHGSYTLECRPRHTVQSPAKAGCYAYANHLCPQKARGSTKEGCVSVLTRGEWSWI